MLTQALKVQRKERSGLVGAELCRGECLLWRSLENKVGFRKWDTVGFRASQPANQLVQALALTYG